MRMLRTGVSSTSRQQRAIIFMKCFSSDATFSRRDLSPLIKSIHPDLFGQASDIIKRTNLSCLQSINEMCDSIEGLQEVDHSIVEVTKPLKTQYVFQCYMRTKEKQQIATCELASELQTMSVRVLLNTPTTLCTRQRLSQTTLNKSLEILLYQLSPLFEQASLESPFKNPGQKVKEKEFNYDRGTFFLEDKSLVDLVKLQREVDIRTFETLITQRSRAVRSSIFVTPSSKSRESKKRQWTLMNEEVEGFLMNGNVLVKGLEPLVEIQAIQSLRLFFQDYGALINFSTSQWRYVILVLFDKSTLPKVKPTQNTDSIRNNGSKGMKKAFDQTGFRCVKEGKSYLVEIPHTFRIPALLEFFRLNLPLTSPTAEYTK